MTIAYKLLFSASLLAGSWGMGAYYTQTKWDQDIAIRAALLDQAEKQNKETINDLNTQHQKDIKSATSKAGRDAINKWLAANGVLPNSLPVRQTTGTDTTIHPEVSNAASAQQEPRGGIESFALRCAQDALIVTDWQELAIRERWKVVD